MSAVADHSNRDYSAINFNNIHQKYRKEKQTCDFA